MKREKGRDEERKGRGRERRESKEKGGEEGEREREGGRREERGREGGEIYVREVRETYLEVLKNSTKITPGVPHV